MSTEAPDANGQSGPARGSRLNREVGAGLFLLALAAVGFVGAYPLKFGQMTGIGPGLMPKSTAVLVAAFGLLLLVQGLTSLGDRLEAWSLRGILFVLGGVVAFAATVRPLGLVVAGPLAIIISSFADKSTRLIEVVIFAVVMTAASIALFKFMLRQPIPLAPFILGY